MGVILNPFTGELEVVKPTTGFLTKSQADTYYQSLSGFGIQGSVLFAGAGGVLAQDYANFFWDDTNYRLGIGTTSPQATIDMLGGVLSTQTLLDTQMNLTYAHNFYGNMNAVTTANGTNYASMFTFNLNRTVPTGVTDAGYAIGGYFNVFRTATIAGYPDDSGTLAYLYGTINQYGHGSSGLGQTPITTNVIGQYLHLYHESGNIVNAKDIWIRDNVTDAGTITNHYGIDIGALTGTNTWGIYQEGASNPNYFAGNVGIGTTAPTALLNLVAGTATARTAPLKFTAGVNLTTPEAGAVEYDGTHLYFTAINGGTRYQLDQQSAGVISSVSNSDGTLTISPTTGAVVASLALAHANTWTGQQTFNTSAALFGIGIITPLIYPSSNSTTAIMVNKADATTNVLTIDTTNVRLGIGVTPDESFHNLGNIKTKSAFTFTLNASSSTATVTYPVAFKAGTTPVVVCTPPYQTSFWITAITATGFTFNIGTTNGYAQTINCIAMAKA